MSFLKKFKALGATLSVIAVIGLAGCGEEGSGEKAGKEADKAIGQAGDAMKDMQKKLGK